MFKILLLYASRSALWECLLLINTFWLINTILLLYVKQLATSCGKNSRLYIYYIWFNLGLNVPWYLCELNRERDSNKSDGLKWCYVCARQIHSTQQPVYVTVQRPRGGGGGEESRAGKARRREELHYTALRKGLTACGWRQVLAKFLHLVFCLHAFVFGWNVILGDT